MVNRERYGSWNKALVCYNHGENGAYNNVFKFGKVDTEYSKKVMRRYKKWNNILAEKGGK